MREPSLFQKFTTGQSAQPNRTATGFDTSGLSRPRYCPARFEPWPRRISGPHRKCKSFQFAVPSFESFADAIETKMILLSATFMLVKRPGEFDFLSVGNGAGGRGKTRANRLLLRWMDVFRVADIGDDGDADVGQNFVARSCASRSSAQALSCGSSLIVIHGASWTQKERKSSCPQSRRQLRIRSGNNVRYVRRDQRWIRPDTKWRL